MKKKDENYLYNWLKDQLEMEIANKMWMELFDKMEKLKTEAYTQIQEVAKKEAEKLLTRVKLDIKEAKNK